MDNHLFEQIRQFVESEQGRCRFALTPETTLEGDLHITGDDADEFLAAFGNRFHVDVSGFDYAAYFGSEGTFRNLPTPGKIPLTLGDLCRAAETGEMHETESFKRIIRFVQDEKRGFTGPFFRKTSLYRHLKLRGDRARDFIEAFGKELGVDISGFDFDRYFRPRRFAIFDSALRKRITLGDLEKAVLKKRLI